MHIKQLIFYRVLDRFKLRERNDLILLIRIAFYDNVWVLSKNFQEIKLFIFHCSFITLAQKTTMRLQIVRFLETFRGPFLELK